MADLIHLLDKGQAKTVLGYGDGKADASVLIGGNMTDRFWPTIKAGKWNNEAWLSISRRGVDIPRGKFGIFQNGRMELVTRSTRDTYYITPDGHLEYEISFNDSLPTYVDLDLDFPVGMSFWKQLALTQEEINEGFARPEDIINAYVVQWYRKNNKYKTGKHSVIKRPFLKDANNNKVWCDQEVDGNTLRIIPENEVWLQSARYPIMVGPNIGYETAGSSDAGISTTVWHNSEATDGSGGNVQSFHVAILTNTGNKDIKIAIYDDNANPNNLLEGVQFTPGVSDDESTASIDNDLLTASTTYWASIIGEDLQPRVKFDNVGSSRKTTSTTFGGEFTDPAVSNGTNALSLSAWIVYEPAAGGLSIPIAMYHYQHH